MTITAYPLAWPVGWKRTPAREQAAGRFSASKLSSYGPWKIRESIAVAQAISRLLAELQRMGAQREGIVLSTNLTLRQDGLPRSGQAQPRDPGAAVYWRDPFNGQPRCMAIDRHGGGEVLERTFTGFAALPASGAPRDWQVVLELQDLLMPTRADVERAYRRLAAQHHPDKGGSAERMAEINRARNEALAWIDV